MIEQLNQFDRTKAKRLDTHVNSLFHNHFIGVINLQQTDLKIALANVKACEILGEYDFTEKYFDQYLIDENAVFRFHETILAESANDFEIQIVQRGGKSRWVSIYRSAFTSEGFIEILMFDITDDKKKIEDLQRVNYQMNQFIHHISHDLRAPIITLLGLINLSKKEIHSMETLQGYIDLMLVRTKYLDSILVDLTSIALNEKTALDLGTVNIEEEIKSIIDQYDDPDNHVSIKQEVTESQLFITDVKRVRIILRNLVSNSIKYQNPSQKNPFVKISVTVETHWTNIEIEDNGIGIHPLHTKKIFEMFFRGTDKSSGSGLGLYIVKSIVDKLGGKITLFSAPDKGSIFKVMLPNHTHASIQTTKDSSKRSIL